MLFPQGKNKLDMAHPCMGYSRRERNVIDLATY